MRTMVNQTLTAAQFDKFAAFMADVTARHSKKTGILFNHISPVNEPQWDWSDGGQEGTPFYNNEIAGIARSLSKALIKNNLSTKLTSRKQGKSIICIHKATNRDVATRSMLFLTKHLLIISATCPI
jgi:hypothetical protein